MKIYSWWDYALEQMEQMKKDKEDKWVNPLDEAIEELKKKENIKIVEIDSDEPLDDEDCYGAED